MQKLIPVKILSLKYIALKKVILKYSSQMAIKFKKIFTYYLKYCHFMRNFPPNSSRKNLNPENRFEKRLTALQIRKFLTYKKDERFVNRRHPATLLSRRSRRSWT